MLGAGGGLWMVIAKPITFVITGNSSCNDNEASAGGCAQLEAAEGVDLITAKSTVIISDHSEMSGICLVSLSPFLLCLLQYVCSDKCTCCQF